MFRKVFKLPSEVKTDVFFMYDITTWGSFHTHRFSRSAILGCLFGRWHASYFTRHPVEASFTFQPRSQPVKQNCYGQKVYLHGDATCIRQSQPSGPMELQPAFSKQQMNKPHIHPAFRIGDEQRDYITTTLKK